jgi:hypothetical protein
LLYESSFGSIVAMKQQICKNCIHWKRKTDHFEFNPFGVCSGINDGDDLEVFMVTGWEGGHVDYIETKETFGCLHYEKR